MSSLIKYSYSNSATKTATATTILTAAAASSSFFLLGPRATQQSTQHHPTDADGHCKERNEKTITTRYPNGSKNNSRIVLPPIITAREAAYHSPSFIATEIMTSPVAFSTTKRNFSTNTTTSDYSNSNKNDAWEPNLTTSMYTKMQSTCPDVIKAYAQCVISKQNEGVLEQGVCETEYERLMDCFRMVRSSSSSS
eukprot:scaffold3248_cov150-Skeletonema_menzelii.AAC.9